MRVAAVVVTYNRSALLVQCVEHLRAQKVPVGWQLDIMVIDNASTDDTVYALMPFIEDGAVRYYNTGSNLGGAGGFAFGMKQAAALGAGYDYLWVMDDDCLPDPDAFAAFVEAADQLAGQPEQSNSTGQSVQPPSTTHWGFLSSVVRWKDGSPCAMNIQRHPLFKNIEDFSPKLQPATLASFVSLFVPTHVVREVGLPYAEFFIWTDDWEFTRRISRKYPCYVVGTSKVVHASATNNPGNIYTDPPERLDRYNYIYRNDVVLYREEGIRGILFVWVRALYHTLQVLMSNVDEKRRRIDTIWRGTREGFTFRPHLDYPA